ncbi:MAG: glycoside hydrolase family 127 protein [Verrucomicrobia bacterium]|nr:glycoside hydrolase family 127 protein [Verrucomicrobiota bacterium]
MKNKYCFCILLGLALSIAGSAAPSDKIPAMQFVSFKQVKVDDPFWSPKFDLWQHTTAVDVLDKFEGKHIKEEGNHNTFFNFDQVARGDKGTGGHFGPPWFDGLIYESIRGIADYLAQNPDPEMEKRLDGYIERIEAAQKADSNGYLDTYTDLNEPDHRWGENGGFLRWQHDVYNAGMLIEAGVHYYQATGKTKLLTVATRLANYMYDYMGPSDDPKNPKKNVVPSHSGPEEAMVKLYWLYLNHPELKNQIEVPVDENHYLQLVTHWIENRGHHCGFPNWEEWGNERAEKWIKECRYEDPRFGDESRPCWGNYAQDRIPVFEQQTIEGHAVRATLMATGLSTLALVNHQPEYIETAKRLWDNMAGKRMFITGGVGAIHYDEKFGPDYYLPSDAYLETCAAIGAAFFSQRMTEITGNAMYMDEVERVLFNSLMTAVSLSGTNYTYQNPLNAVNHNRWEWHGCPCCPPMFLKITSAIPGYIYAQKNKDLFVNLFISSQADIPVSQNNSVTLKQETSYPWNGKVTINVMPQKKSRFTLKIRIPGWARGIENPYGLYTSNLEQPVTLKLNGKPYPIQIKDGYALIHRNWKNTDQIELDLPVQPRIIYAHPEVKNLNGKASLAAGPVIYAFENCDNSDFDKIILNSKTPLEIKYMKDLLGGVNQIQCQGSIPATAIPYYAIANRQRNSSHKVWVPQE